MLTTVEGVYHDGKIELSEVPRNIQEDVFVLVTFMSLTKRDRFVDLRERGIGPEEAADLRMRLATFSEDWDSPEMEVYDNYDTIKSSL